MLGGKSVNGLPVLFPYEDSVPYHIYYKVMNAKKHGVPQNRQRVFIIGIRYDQDNNFRWAKEEHLTKRLKNVLENEADEKYFLSETIINGFLKHKERHEEKQTGFKWQPKNENDTANTLRANAALCPTDNTIEIKSATKKLNDNQQNKLDKLKVDPHVSGTLTEAIGRGGSSSEYLSMLKKVKKNTGNMRRLTPRECFRLMDFPDTFTWTCSDSQAYKQAGNSIVVRCLELIIKQFNL